MYYVDYLGMIASYLKPSLNSLDRASRLRNDKRFLEQKNHQNLLKPLLASLCFLLCIVVIPDKSTNIASICEKYNPSVACEVW